MTKQTSKSSTGLCRAGLSQRSNEVTADFKPETSDSLKTEAKRDYEEKTGDQKKLRRILKKRFGDEKDEKRKSLEEKNKVKRVSELQRREIKYRNIKRVTEQKITDEQMIEQAGMKEKIHEVKRN